MRSTDTLKGWIALLRPPNLPTVPGDPLAGLFLASGIPGWNLLWLALSSLALYGAGLILNDVADVEIDRRERPGRPLPSGAVARCAARAVGLSAGLVGIAAAAMVGPAVLIVAALLFATILVYTFLTPRGSLAGILTMGLCRALSVGLGIAAAKATTLPWPALVAAAGIGAYIVAVSWIAANETVTQHLDGRRWLPTIAAGLTLAGVAFLLQDTRHFFILVAISAFAIFRIGLQTVQLGSRPSPGSVPRAIGGLIRCLLLMQAAFCASQHPGLVLAALLILMQPLSAQLGRRFYAS